MRFVHASTALVAVLLVGCGGASDVGSSPSSVAVTGGDGTLAATPPPTDDDLAGAAGTVEAASSDLSQRLGVPVQDIEVVAHEEVTWRDGSLGCPQEGMAYTQAITPGYRIVLGVAGADHHYHGAAGQPPAYCADPVDGATVADG